jgi:voltage-gated potassium channel
MTSSRWKNIMEWPLTAAALIFLSAYAWSVIGNLRGPNSALSELVMNSMWAVFAIDYVFNLLLAKPRGPWFLRNFHHLLIVALPVLRPMRLLRLVSLITILHRTAGRSLRGRITTYVSGSVVLLVIVAGLAVLDSEQNASGSNIRNIGDALWWAFVTITTVGYGDFYPVTVVGRLIAVGLMICGVALIGSVTAAFASWFIELVGTPIPEKMHETGTHHGSQLDAVVSATPDEVVPA